MLFDSDFSFSNHVVFIYLGFYVAFNTVQVISRRVVGRLEETSTCSSLRFCTVNCQPTASNYQLSHLRPCRGSNPGLRSGRRECYHSATVAPLNRVVRLQMVFNTTDGTKEGKAVLLTWNCHHGSKCLFSNFLDYCYALFRSLWWFNSHKLHHIQNSLAKMVTNSNRYVHVTHPYKPTLASH